jgi:hypothetical protein
MTPIRTTTKAAAGLVALAISACGVVLPRHPRSAQLRGERTTITMLTLDDFNVIARRINYHELTELDLATWSEPSGPTARRGRAEFAAAAVLAPIVAGMAVDFVKTQLEEEASRYEAQYTARVAEDLFWIKKGNGFQQHWAGFQMTRSTTESGAAPAFELVCLFQPGADPRLLRVKPVFIRIAGAKAKVLGHRWWAPWTRLMSDEELEVNVDVELDGMWMDEQQHLHANKLAALAFKVTGYELGPAAPILDPAPAFGWFPGVPRTKGIAEGSGAFTLEVKVTERDPSRAKQLVDRAGKELAAHRSDIVQAVTPKATTTTTTLPHAPH